MTKSFISDIVVVDTNVVSYIWKRDTRGTLYTPHLKGRQWIIAAQTFAELEAWPLKNGWGAIRHEALRAYLNHYTFAEVDGDDLSVTPTRGLQLLLWLSPCH